tara:strand:+ start:41 stop:484 length:444 start_codon:yes stop_codon:yes gene_type:complete
MKNIREYGIIKLLTEKGYTLTFSDLDSCKKHIKFINKLMDIGLLIKVNTYGCEWFSKEKAYNVVIGFKSNTLYSYSSKEMQITIYELFKFIVKVVKSTKKQVDLEEIIPQSVKCGKCDGQGFLKHYEHIFNGTCFSCCGLGYKHKII